jgi:hypothetical protein
LFPFHRPSRQIPPRPEIEQLSATNARFVTVEWIRPGARKGERITVPIEDFNLLAGPRVMDNAIRTR